MTWIRPVYLWLLLIAPLLVGLTALEHRRRQRDARALGVAPLARSHAGWFLVAAWLLTALALVGLRWGNSPASALPPGHDLVLLVDVSRSMAVADAVPDRLAVAREAAELLVRETIRDPGTRIGVVAMAGRGVVRCPLTTNLGAVLDCLNALRPGSVRPGGTDLAAGLRAAADLLEGDAGGVAAGRSIVLLSDGEDLTGQWLPAAQELADRSILVHTLGVGDDTRAHPVPDGGPDGEVLVYKGEEVLSRRQDEPLRQIAALTKGAWLPLGLARPSGLDTLYRTRIEPVARLRRAVASGPRGADRSGVFLLAGIVCLALGMARPRRAIALAALLVLAAGADGAPVSVAESIRRGNAAHAVGDRAGALRWYENAIARQSGSALARYNAASVLCEMKRFDDAIEQLERARASADPELTLRIDFVQGNTAFALGRRDEAIGLYDRCVGSPLKGRTADALRAAALENRRFAERSQPSEPAEAGSPASDDPSPGGSGRPEVPEPRPMEGPAVNDGGPTSRPEFTGESPASSSEPQPPTAQPPTGDAGNLAPADPGLTAATPEERLEQALQRARAARQRRLVRPDTPEDGGDERKTW